MEGKVLLFDANGVEIGETYTRRARQLVKQQRAIWADDSHTAIQFMPDAAEAWELHPPEAELTPSPASTTAPVPTADKSSILYTLAEKRMEDRRRLILHSVLLIPGYIGVMILWVMLTGNRMFNLSFLTMGIAWGMWTMSYITRLRAYIKAYSLKTNDWQLRRRIRLEAEVDRLKRLGYSD